MKTVSTKPLMLVNCIETFVYKGRRWWRGAFLPWLGEYECHTVTGDRVACLSPNLIVDNVKPNLVDRERKIDAAKGLAW